MDQIGKQGRRTDEYGNPIGQQAGHGVGAGGALAHGTGGTAQMMHPEQQGRRTDEYGNPTKDAYGNPVGQQGYGHETGVIGTGTGNDVLKGTGTGGGVTHGPGGTAQMTHPEQHQQKGGILHRSGSSSSSSSEDDGMGGRRKKGIKEKIKEKLPGHKKTDEFGQPIQGQGQAHTTTGATTAYGGTGTGATTGYGGTGTGAGTGAAGFREPEKKGMVDKIKEKLPGHQNK